MVILERSAYLGSSRMAMRGIIHGLEPNFHGMWHFHRGFNCLAATEDTRLYEGIYSVYRTMRTPVRGGDDWTYGSYTADPSGVVLLSQTFVLDSPDLISTISREMAGLEGECEGWMPPTFYGRQMIVHGREGQYLGCGTVSGFLPGVTDALGSMTKYRLYDGVNATALVHVKSLDSGLDLTAVLTGLPPNSGVVFRVHAGFECPGHDPVISKLYPIPDQPDGSSIQTGYVLYTMNADVDEFGNAFIQQALDGATMSHVAGRVVIAATADDVELACGTIEPTSALIQPIVPQQAVRGSLIVAAQTSSGVALRGVLLFDSATPTGTIDVAPSCTDSAQPILQIPFNATDGAYQLKQHVLGVSINALDDSSQSLRGTFIKISSSGIITICAGSLSGPAGEVPTPRADLCTVKSGLRGVVVGFTVLGAAGILLIAALLVLLNFDSFLGGAKGGLKSGRKRVQLARQLSLGSIPRSASRLSARSSQRSSFFSRSSFRRDTEVFNPETDVMVAMHAFRSQHQAVHRPLNVAHSTDLNKPRLLALHGTASNSSVTRLQLKNLGIDESLFEIHCETLAIPRLRPGRVAALAPPPCRRCPLVTSEWLVSVKGFTPLAPVLQTSMGRCRVHCQTITREISLWTVLSTTGTTQTRLPSRSATCYAPCSTSS